MWAMRRLAHRLLNGKKYSEAKAMFEQLDNLWTRVFGEDAVDTISDVTMVACCSFRLNKYAEAAGKSQQAFILSTRVRGDMHLKTIKNLNNLATCLCRQLKSNLPRQRRSSVKVPCAIVQGVLGGTIGVSPHKMWSAAWWAKASTQRPRRRCMRFLRGVMAIVRSICSCMLVAGTAVVLTLRALKQRSIIGESSMMVLDGL